MLSAITLRVSSVVQIDQQGICSSEGAGSFPSISFLYEKGGISSSPSCLVICEKSMEFELTLTGVPVLNLKSGTPSELSEEDKKINNLRYFKARTQSDVAKALGMTQVQVSRREKVILKQMRSKLL